MRVDHILKGVYPAHLPVEAPIKHEFVINHKTGQGIRLRIPTALVLRGDAVIEREQFRASASVATNDRGWT